MKQTMNRILAVVLLLAIFAVGGATMITAGRELAYATFVTYRYYLSTEPKMANNLFARIQSLNNAININLFSKSWFQSLNTQLQLALGKQMLSYGTQTMVWLKTGQLYDLVTEADSDKVNSDIGKMEELNDALAEKNIPMLFVYYHTGLYEDGLLPDGVTDYNETTANTIVDGLRDAGLTVLDTRELYHEKGLTLGETIYNTDQHLAMPMNFEIYRAAADWIRETAGVDIDSSVTDPDNFNRETLTGAHRSSLGERVGSGADDFPIYTPKFDTRIHERIALDGGYAERDGSFADAVLNLNRLDDLEETGYADIYNLYGYHREEVYYTNESAADARALIVKDSFGTPVASLLSLAVQDELAIDLRKTHRSVLEYVEEYAPDFVVVLHCQEMMRGSTNYVFVD